MKTKVRKRGTAIVHTPEGILLVMEQNGILSLPGGGVERGESLMIAACRELEEETGLKAIASTSRYLFTHLGHPYRIGKQLCQNQHHVYLVQATGSIQIDSEILGVHFYPLKDKLPMSNSTQKILNRYILERFSEGNS